MRTCKKCGEHKPEIAFGSSGAARCKKCRILSKVELSNSYMEREGLDVIQLATDKPILIMTRYLIPKFIVNYSVAIEAVEKYETVILDETTIFLKEVRENHNEDDILIRINVLERDKYRCYYCDGRGDTVDHIHPKCEGGEFTEENLVTACRRCNSLKSHHLITKEEMREFMQANKHLEPHLLGARFKHHPAIKREVPVAFHHRPKTLEQVESDISVELAKRKRKPKTLDEMIFATIGKKRGKGRFMNSK